jgi:NAD:arginine ADP-ribosyltransferase
MIQRQSISIQMDLEEYAKLHLQRDIKEIENSPIVHEDIRLSLYEKAFIYNYSEDGYESLNHYIRWNGGENDHDYGIFLAQSLEKLPNYEGLVYRRVSLTRAEFEKYLDSLRKQEPITELAFVSTSKQRNIAYAYHGDYFFIIVSKTGKEIEKITKYKEYEVLFLPKTQFRVLETTERDRDGLIKIIMEEI